MHPISRCLLVASLNLGWFAVSTADAAVFKLGSHDFTLPEGFTIERVAGPGLTDRPIHGDFDEQGRLYIAESSGSNDPVKKQAEDKPHSILRLEDTDGDGVFDRRTLFADKLMFPEGVLYHDGSVYVTAPPEIWKLTDTDGDGIADRREVWFNPGTLTGCANDLHGPFLGRDGWIYWSKGAFAEQQLDLVGGGKLVTKAAHIFRRLPSGGGVEAVMTGGMDNPVEFVMTLGGDRFFTSTFMLHPGGGKRDGIGHASYGAMFGKDHDVLNDHPRTLASLNQPITHLGPAAPAGLCVTDSGLWGAEYRGNLFAALFNLHKVTRHVLSSEGSAFRATDQDFLTSDNRDFHPTDVFEDADGSLIVIDTGGWYKICCPTSQLYKPDVLGAIYRIRKTASPKRDDPRGLRIDWKTAGAGDLARLLEDDRAKVQQRAVRELAGRGASAVPSIAGILRRSANPTARALGVWALSRINEASARSFTAVALLDVDETVRQAALHAMALWRDRDAVPQLLAIMKDGTPANQRVAAEALGRIRDSAALPALLGVVAKDTLLAQAATRAMIDIGDAPAVRTLLAGTAAADARRAALVLVLDQLRASALADVLPLLQAGDEASRETALWIMGRHKDWGPQLADLLLRNGETIDEGRAATLLAGFAGDVAVQHRMTAAVRLEGYLPRGQRIALQAMAAARLKNPPAEWGAAIVFALSDANQGQLPLAIAAARACQFKEPNDELAKRLESLARSVAISPELRLAALAARPAGGGLADDQFALALNGVGAEQPVAIRQTAVEVLRQAKRSPAQVNALIAKLPDVGPLELQALVALFEQGGDESTGRALVSALAVAKGKGALRPETLRPLLEKFPEVVRAQAQPLLASLEPDRTAQQARIEKLLAELQGGDVRRGQEIFNSPKSACSVCHGIGYLGGNIGPDLTKIGQVRNERDLLEAIVYPSASFVRSFEPMTVVTKEGEDFNGVIREDAADHLLLATGPGATVRVARASITELRPSGTSIMPGGLDEQLSRQELADLLAFLKATQW